MSRVGRSSCRTHPCVNQFGSCQFGDMCAYKDYPGEICVLYLQGKCTSGCGRVHNELLLVKAQREIRTRSRARSAHPTPRSTVTKHPCVSQFGSCQFGDGCKFKDLPANVCVFFLQGKCNSNDCTRVHKEEYLQRPNRRTLSTAPARRPTETIISSGVKAFTQEIRQKVYLKLVVDCSGSMVPYFDTLVSSIQGVSSALREDDRISVVAFSKTPQMVATLIPKELFYMNKLKKAINSEKHGRTALFDSIVFSTETLGKEIQEICKQNKNPKDAETKVIIGVLTDGMDNRSKKHSASSAAMALAASGAEVIVMGINVGRYSETLKSLCPNKNNYIDESGNPADAIERALSMMKTKVQLVIQCTSVIDLTDLDPKVLKEASSPNFITNLLSSMKNRNGRASECNSKCSGGLARSHPLFQ